MAIDTKLNFNCGKFKQCSGDIMNLSGCTQIYGIFDIESNATLTICDNAGVGKILTSNANGVATWQAGGITAISGGSGMNFSPITTTGEIILGTPSAILNTSIDVSSGTTHIHAFSASTFVTGTQGILVDGNNRFYLDDVYVTDSILPDLYSFSGITANQNLGSLPTGQTLGMVYITNTGTTAATVNLGTTALGNDITPFQPIDIDAGEDVSITVNMRLSLSADTTIYINSDDWTNVGLNVQWANVTFKNVPLPTGSTSGLLTASNGLTAVSQDVKLGGSLTENTCIAGAGSYGIIMSGLTHFCADTKPLGGAPISLLTEGTLTLEGCNVCATFAGGHLDLIDNTSATQIELSVDGNIRFCNLQAKSSETNVVYINSSTGRLASGATDGGGVGTLQQVTDCGCVTTNSIIIGSGNTATGLYSLAQGCCNQATGITSHAEGEYNYAYGCASHAEGESAYACGYASHAEGMIVEAHGCGSHAEGVGSCALGCGSHAEGEVTCAVSCGSHAEGFNTKSIGASSHAEGDSTVTCGVGSHAEGCATNAVNNYSHAEGCDTVTSGTTMLHASGKFNISKDYNIYEIGVGTSDSLRCNAFEVSTSGDIALPQITGCTASNVLYYNTTDGMVSYGSSTAEIQFAVSDETTDLTTGTAKITFRMPYAMTLSEVRVSVGTAPTGANLIVDINESASTILSTKLSIDAGEKTSTTAATPPVISDSALADDAEITIDIDQIGSTVAGAGLKITFKGTRN